MPVIRDDAAPAHHRIAGIMIDRFENITSPAMTAIIITSNTGKPVNDRFMQSKFLTEQS